MAIDARFSCPKCNSPLHVPAIDATPMLRCTHCDWSDEVDLKAFSGPKLNHCPICRTEEMYVQKDFPERIGMAILVIALVLATICWSYYWWVGTFAVLLGSFLLDAMLFFTRPNVSICYRCLGQFRQVAPNPAHQAFDLGVGEKYRQERLRKQGHS